MSKARKKWGRKSHNYSVIYYLWKSEEIDLYKILGQEQFPEKRNAGIQASVLLRCRPAFVSSQCSALLTSFRHDHLISALLTCLSDDPPVLTFVMNEERPKAISNSDKTLLPSLSDLGAMSPAWTRKRSGQWGNDAFLPRWLSVLSTQCLRWYRDWRCRKQRMYYRSFIFSNAWKVPALL
jgi:hypothetical protein